MKHLRLTAFCVSIAWLGIGAQLAADEHAIVSFSRDVRPILSNHCFQCHGPDENRREAELRLDNAAGASSDRGGYAAVLPGQPLESELIKRVRSTDSDLRMPPPDHGERLSEEQIAILEQWISQGGEYSNHWSFEPINTPVVPAITAAAPRQWQQNPIDAFIHRQLQTRGITPSPEAPRSTLIRRVYLDLLGLPPDLDQVETYLMDGQPGAYERMLDAALASEHFGERWGRHWLDQARYADSHGYTNDNERSIWPYRDWVIDAFNRDLPFDQFTIEQLAGDLLNAPTLAQRVATGFHRNTLINSEGGTKADQFRDEQVKDRTDTTGLVWMGLTVGCAKCHTHKFDPLSQVEYYKLYAFFNSTTDNNSVTPTLSVPSREQNRRLESLRQQRDQLAAQIAHDSSRAERQAAWESQLLESRATVPADSDQSNGDAFPWSILELSGKSDQETVFENLPDKSLLARGPGAAKEEYQSTARSPLTRIRSVRLEVLTHDSLPKSGPGRAGNGNFVLSEFWFRTGDGRELRFSKAMAEHSQPQYSVSQAIDGKGDTGWAINGAPEGTLNHNRTAWFNLPETLEVEEQHALVFKMQFHVNDDYAIGRYRLSVSDQEWLDRPDLAMIGKLVAIPAEQRSEEQQLKIDKAFMQADPYLRDIDATREQVVRQIESLEQQIPTTLVLQELEKPRQAYVQVRGDFLRHGEQVAPDVPHCLPPLGTDQSADRLRFAQWLVDPQHPLTSRVRVNRMWMRLFGRGLVETENDFGVQGSLPTHPELLDWLASEFIRRGWSTKQLLKLMMTSATYRQSSNVRPDLASLDARNLWLARQRRLRVEAEIVRDIALAVSGSLSHKIGGPSVFPPQPDGVYAFTQRAKKWSTSLGEDRFRRGMYTFFYRSAPYPMLSTFDVPKFNQVCTARDRSNTPLQSLTLSNSEALLELADALGRRITSEVVEESDRLRIEHAYHLCFARSATDSEVQRLTQYVQDCRRRFNTDDQVWPAVARVLMNLDEFVTRE